MQHGKKHENQIEREESVNADFNNRYDDPGASGCDNSEDIVSGNTDGSGRLTYEETVRWLSSPLHLAWERIKRRHSSNIFDALFKDRETISSEDIKERIKQASEFFDLPIPEIVDRCDTLAKIRFCSDLSKPGKISFNLNKLEQVGINNVDAFDSMLSHELSHQFLSHERFNFCDCKEWCVELACDFIAGVRCSAKDIASGKFKFAVSGMKMSTTHPDGRLRIEAVEAGFKFAEWLRMKNLDNNAQMSLIGIRRFLSEHSKELNQAYHGLRNSPPAQPLSPPDYMELPDTNLIKQALSKINNLKRNNNHE